MFDFAKVEVDSVIPDGELNCSISKAEWKTSKAGTDYLSLGFQVLEGNHKGKIVWNMYNLLHEKEQPRNIALQDMKRLLAAVDVEAGQLSKEDLVEKLLGKMALVKFGNRTDDYGTKNTVKGYKKATIGEESLPF